MTGTGARRAALAQTTAFDTITSTLLELFMLNTRKASLIAISGVFAVFSAWAQVPPKSQPVASPTVTSALSQQTATQLSRLLAAGKLDEALRQARNAGLDLKAFATFAAQNGVSVADITIAVLNSGVPVATALKALGAAFAVNMQAVATVFATAITMPNITLDPATVEASIEAGCTKDCLPAPLVSNLVNEPANPYRSPALMPTSTTNSSSSGSGSGGSKPISPTS